MGWSKSPIGDTSWQPITLTSPWATLSGFTSGFRKDGSGFVHVEGVIQGGSASGSTPVFTLPAGYRPLANKYFVVQVANGSTPGTGYMEVHADGTVYITVAGTSWTALDQIQFLGEQ